MRRVGRVTLEPGRYGPGDVVVKFDGLKVHHHELAEMARGFVQADEAKMADRAWIKDPLVDLLEFLERYILARDEDARELACDRKNTRYLGTGKPSVRRAYKSNKPLPYRG